MQAVFGIVSQKLTALCAAIAIGTLPACAAPSSYMGIEFAPVAAAGSEQSQIQLLVRRAQSGDKQAQLELGVRFEEGRGVVRDLEKAKIVYQLAAQDTPIKQTSFIPEGGTIRAETTNAGVRKGLPEAKERFAKSVLTDGHGATTANAGPARKFYRIHGAGTRGVEAILEMVKVEYFSDQCFYEAPRSREILAELGYENLEEVDVKSEKFLMSVADSCFFRKTLPNNCLEYKTELRKVLIYLIGIRKSSVVARAFRSLVLCLTVKGQSPSRESKNPTPMDFELFGTDYFNSNVQEQTIEIAHRVPRYGPAGAVSHIYWRDQCGHTVMNSEFSLSTMLFCSDRVASDQTIKEFEDVVKVPNEKDVE